MTLHSWFPGAEVVQGTDAVFGFVIEDNLNFHRVGPDQCVALAWFLHVWVAITDKGYLTGRINLPDHLASIWVEDDAIDAALVIVQSTYDPEVVVVKLAKDWVDSWYKVWYFD